jgi:hypothetical protein
MTTTMGGNSDRKGAVAARFDNFSLLRQLSLANYTKKHGFFDTSRKKDYVILGWLLVDFQVLLA